MIRVPLVMICVVHSNTVLTHHAMGGVIFYARKYASRYQIHKYFTIVALLVGCLSPRLNIFPLCHISVAPQVATFPAQQHPNTAQLISAPITTKTIHNSMADPLSILASTAGLLALAVEVGNGLAQIISEAKATDSVLTELTNDLIVLGTILNELAAISTWRESGGDQLLPAALDRCDRSLKELQGIIEVFQASVEKGGLRKQWLQVTWITKQKQIAGIAVRISEHKSTLTLALQMQNA